MSVFSIFLNDIIADNHFIPNTVYISEKSKLILPNNQQFLLLSSSKVFFMGDLKNLEPEKKKLHKKCFMKLKWKRKWENFLFSSHNWSHKSHTHSVTIHTVYNKKKLMSWFSDWLKNLLPSDYAGREGKKS